MGTPMDRDGCARRTKGCIHPTDAGSHAVPWIQASRAKDRSIQGSRTPMGSHGSRQAGIWTAPLARSRAPMRFHECQDAGTRTSPFAGCGHPWDLMAAGKRRTGESLGPKARGHGIRSIRGSDAKGAPLRGTRPPMRPHRRGDRTGGTWRSTKRASRVEVFEPRVDRKASPIDPKGDTRRPRGCRDKACRPLARQVKARALGGVRLATGRPAGCSRRSRRSRLWRPSSGRC
jgi:hypothetical protein